MYVAYDERAKVHSQPIFTKNDSVAKRIFAQLVNGNERHPYSTNPEDFQIICIGTYDDEAGQCYKNHKRDNGDEAILDTAMIICRMEELKQQEKDNG